MREIELISYSIVHKYLLDRYPTAENYDDRIIAQKVGYLVQSEGIYLGEGINFFWYKRGPYSRALTAMLFKIENNIQYIKKSCSSLVLKEGLKPKLDNIKKVINLRPKHLPEVYWLEINASIKYLKNENPTFNNQQLSDLLINRKPFLNIYLYDIKYALENNSQS